MNETDSEWFDKKQKSPEEIISGAFCKTKFVYDLSLKGNGGLNH